MSGSLLFSWVVVMATGVRVTCVAAKSGLGRTEEECVFSVEIVGSFIDFDRFFYESWHSY